MSRAKGQVVICPRSYWIILSNGSKVHWSAVNAREAATTFRIAFPEAVIQDIMGTGHNLVERKRWQ